MSDTVGDAKDDIEKAVESKEFRTWWLALLDRYQDEVAGGASGVVEMSADAIRVFYRNAVQFWQRAKPAIPPVDQKVDALTVAKNLACCRQIADLDARIRAAGAGEDIDVDSDPDSDLEEQGDET